MEGNLGNHAEILFQRLEVSIDFERQALRGTSTLWLRLGRDGGGDASVVHLHCRQCHVLRVAVSGIQAQFQHRDALTQVVLPEYRDAESFDTYYRTLLRTVTEDDAGELVITLPPDLPVAPALPPSLPASAPALARARQLATAQLVAEALGAAEDAAAAAEVSAAASKVADDTATTASEAAAAAEAAEVALAHATAEAKAAAGAALAPPAPAGGAPAATAAPAAAAAADGGSQGTAGGTAADASASSVATDAAAPAAGAAAAAAGEADAAGAAGSAKPPAPAAAGGASAAGSASGGASAAGSASGGSGAPVSAAAARAARIKAAMDAAGKTTVAQNESRSKAETSAAAKVVADAAKAAYDEAKGKADAVARLCGGPNARTLLVKVEVTYELLQPRTGVVFKHAGNVSGGGVAEHLYTTYRHTPVDPDGPRCWFPCLDTPSKQTIFDLHVTLDDSRLVPLCSGLLIDESEEMEKMEQVEEGMRQQRRRKRRRTYRFCTETPLHPRALGLAVGPFRVRELRDASRISVASLPPPTLQPPRKSGSAAGAGDSHDRGNGSSGGGGIVVDADAAAAAARKVSREASHVCSHLGRALRFLEGWLDAPYPFQRCTVAFVAGLDRLQHPFGGLLLTPVELLAGPKLPESDLPGGARVTLVEAAALGWVAAAVRLRGGTDQWLHHGMAGYLADQYAEAVHGPEPARHRLWSSMRRVADADAELASPSIHPSTPENYILETLDPAQTEFARAKAVVVMHMIEARVTRENLQTVLRLFLQAPAAAADAAAAELIDADDADAEGEEVLASGGGSGGVGGGGGQLRRQRSAEMAVERALAEARMAEEAAGGGGGGGMWIGAPPTHSMLFLEQARATAAAWGREMARDLTDSFEKQYVSGHGVACFVAGYCHNKRSKQMEVFIEQAVPPWTSVWGSGVFSGMLPVEMQEYDGNRARTQYKPIPHAEAPADGARIRYDHFVAAIGKARRKAKAAGAGGGRKSTGDKESPGGEAKTTKGKGKSKAAKKREEEEGMVDSGEEENNNSHNNGSAAAAAAVESAVADASAAAAAGGAASSPEEPQALSLAQEMNLSPVLWVKLDPTMSWLRQVAMRPPGTAVWVEMLFTDSCAAAQADALWALSELPMPHETLAAKLMLPCLAMGQCLRGRVSHAQEEHAACVRAEAATCLALWQNRNAPKNAAVAADVGDVWRGLNVLLRAFAERFEDPAAAEAGGVALLPNWFDNQTEYTLKKAMVWAVANVRAGNGCSPPDVCAFLTRLLRDNDNSENRLRAETEGDKRGGGAAAAAAAAAAANGARQNGSASLQKGNYVDDYYVAGVLVALGQVATAREAGLAEGALAAAAAQAKRWLEWGCLRGSHNGVLAAAALHCLCELELAMGGTVSDGETVATPHVRYASPRFPLAVRVVAIQNVVRQCLARDTAAELDRKADSGESGAASNAMDVDEEFEERIPERGEAARRAREAKERVEAARQRAEAADSCEGLAAALQWVLALVEQERDERVREAAVLVLLDALERRPPRAAFRARFWSDDPLHGAADPWCAREFFQPRGPGGRVAYRSDRSLPRDFPGAAEVAEAAWRLLRGGTAFHQPLRVLLLQLYRDLWGNATPPALAATAAQRPPDWRGDFAEIVAIVKPWVTNRGKRRDWVDRDWLAWRQRHQYGAVAVVVSEQKTAADNYGPTEEQEDSKRQKLNIIRIPGASYRT